MSEIILNHFLSLVTWLIMAAAIIFGLVTVFSSSRKPKDKVRVELEDLSRTFKEDQFEFLQTLGEITENSIFKYKVKKDGGHLFVMDFIGSVDAAEVDSFREEVTALLAIVNSDKDEILVRMDSGGGVVNGYGLVASQIERIKSQNIKVTCSVDEIAASGGYMAACVANTIIAAPFAYIGSIGVVASFPNFKELLDKVGVEFKEYTAGISKRTISQYREISPDQEDEYKKELEETHQSFIEHVKKHRNTTEFKEETFTGKHWLATDALELNLVDEIMTSDEYIESFHNNEKTGSVFIISTHFPRDPVRFLDKFLRMTIRRLQETINKKR